MLLDDSLPAPWRLLLGSANSFEKAAAGGSAGLVISDDRQRRAIACGLCRA